MKQLSENITQQEKTALSENLSEMTYSKYRTARQQMKSKTLENDNAKPTETVSHRKFKTGDDKEPWNKKNMDKHIKYSPLQKKKMKLALDEFFSRKHRETHHKLKPAGSDALSQEVKRVKTLLKGSKPVSAHYQSYHVNTADKISVETAKHFFKYDPEILKKGKISKKSREEEVSSVICDSEHDSESQDDIGILKHLKESLTEAEWNTVQSMSRSRPKTVNTYQENIVTHRERVEKERLEDPFHEDDLTGLEIYEDLDDKSIAGFITKKVSPMFLEGNIIQENVNAYF